MKTCFHTTHLLLSLEWLRTQSHKLTHRHTHSFPLSQVRLPLASVWSFRHEGDTKSNHGCGVVADTDTGRSFPWVSLSPKIAQQQRGETTHDAFPSRDAGITVSQECPELCTNCLREFESRRIACDKKH